MFGRTTLASLGAAVALVTLAPSAHAESVSYTSGGFSQRTVVMAAGDTLTVTNDSGVTVTFVSTSARTTESVQVADKGDSVSYRFNEQAGPYTITVFGHIGTPTPALVVVVTPTF